MKQIIALCIYTSALMLVTACSPESPGLMVQQDPIPETPVEIPQYEMPAQQEFKWITEDGGQSQLDFNPQVDILFVTDNSESMKSAQENLVRNLDRFTNGINKNAMIDYQIGVISTWDSSERFSATKKDKYGIGELRHIKDGKSQNYNKRFVTKKEKHLLASTLDLGVAPYAQGGPEDEEFFAPLTAALEKSGRGGVNEGFFREDAQLVVVFLTDADEFKQSRITPEQMARTLLDFKKGKANKLAVYGALVKASDSDQYKDWALRIHPKYNEQCFDMTQKTPKNNGTCTGFGPEKLEELIVRANEDKGAPDAIKSKYIVGIVNKNFGEDLARIGSDITKKTLAKEIFLTQRPRATADGSLQIRVRYGTPEQLNAGRGQVIPNKANGGWTYDPENNSVLLPGDIEYKYQDKARFAVDLIPLTLAQ
ncbi:hypothetical protein [Bdellovibrio bacteriovorus]|uniref:VWFA domain-containing protein n=1 Tax=Bdellovibrio bacteriovorus TaxID=959 RepID=A0A1Z3NC37_BDEBC|nr:hypothetical protein [Bdellovibrio bacteriovorus]ASD65007.1 hypothetical protein B9G79_16250 [Bdellovibrio bacteriovorus]